MDPRQNPLWSTLLNSLTAPPSNGVPPSSIRLGTPTSGSVDSAIQTIASISDHQTVFITVTRDTWPTSRPSESASPAVDRSDGKGASVGAIAGGVIGGVVILGLALFLLFFLRRKRRAKEFRRATLPPPYVDRDMSGHLEGATNTTAAAADEKARISPMPDSAQQLDSTMIRPTHEMGGDPLGNIPELPAASEKKHDRFATTNSSAESGSSGIRPGKDERKAGGVGDHVMSWAQFNSMGNRDPSSRLSQPHGVPVAVWDNMRPTKNEEEPPDT